jgi:hypothetical protein
MNDLKNDVAKIFEENDDLSRDIFNNQDYPDEDMLSGIFSPHNIVCVPSHEQEGGEDQGSDYYVVSKFSRDDDVVYVKHQGYYSSGNGSDYEYMAFVEPTEVVVIQWKEIGE